MTSPDKKQDTAVSRTLRAMRDFCVFLAKRTAFPMDRERFERLVDDLLLGDEKSAAKAAKAFVCSDERASGAAMRAAVVFAAASSDWTPLDRLLLAGNQIQMARIDSSGDIVQNAIDAARLSTKKNGAKGARPANGGRQTDWKALEGSPLGIFAEHSSKGLVPDRTLRLMAAATPCQDALGNTLLVIGSSVAAGIPPCPSIKSRMKGMFFELQSVYSIIQFINDAPSTLEVETVDCIGALSSFVELMLSGSKRRGLDSTSGSSGFASNHDGTKRWMAFLLEGLQSSFSEKSSNAVCKVATIMIRSGRATPDLKSDAHFRGGASVLALEMANPGIAKDLLLAVFRDNRDLVLDFCEKAELGKVNSALEEEFLESQIKSKAGPPGCKASSV